MLNPAKTAFFVFLLVLSVSLVAAHGDSLEEAKKLIASNVTCDVLDDEQLEAIGEYYMEKMHPGESHEMMDQMMGGEGSKSLEQMHIQMAKSMFCGEGGMMGSGGMMDMMNMMGGNMMGGGMMNMMSGGMMGGSMMGYGYVFGTLYLLLLAGLVALIWLGVIKLWQTIKK